MNDVLHHTQRARAIWMLRRLTIFDTPKVDALFVEIDKLLDESQNLPPHGEADGTIDEPFYAALRELSNAAKHWRAALRVVLEVAWQSVRSKAPSA
jgi:hypothetical protein